MKDSIRPEELIEAFKTFDKGGKGTFNIGQMSYMMQCMGDNLDDQEADDFIAFVLKFKPEGTDEIPYEDIVDALMDNDPKYP